MKLYFYYLKKDNTIMCDVVEAEEKTKSYKLNGKRGTNIFKSEINKNEIKKLNRDVMFEPAVILLSRDDELAKQVFLKDIEQKIEDAENTLRELKLNEDKITTTEISIYVHENA